MSKLYVQYGCGLSAPQEWINFDVSPTLRLQKIPVVGKVLKGRLNVTFPKNVKYGDIIKGLPVNDNSCDGVYCSHTLEHLSLNDFRIALKHTFKILKPNGIFRCIVPDLEFSINEYQKSSDDNDSNASIQFIRNTLLGIEKRPRGIKGLINSFFGNSHHLWMWDSKGLCDELRKTGFIKIRNCHFNDSTDKMFKLVESAGRFNSAVAIECSKG